MQLYTHTNTHRHTFATARHFGRHKPNSGSSNNYYNYNSNSSNSGDSSNSQNCRFSQQSQSVSQLVKQFANMCCTHRHIHTVTYTHVHTHTRTVSRKNSHAEKLCKCILGTCQRPPAAAATKNQTTKTNSNKKNEK